MNRVIFGLLSLSSLTSIFLSCKSVNQGSSSFAIIGHDDRVTTTDPHLLDAVGSLKIRGTAVCTAFLRHSDVIVTAAHCVPFVDSHAFSTLSWTTGSGKTFDVLYTANAYPNADVVFLKLDRKTGLKPLPVNPSIVTDVPILLSGMANGKPTMNPACKFSFTNAVPGAQTSAGGSKVMIHDCDTEPGDSGAPIMQNGYVVGVHLATSLTTSANIGADIQTIMTTDLSTTGYFDRQMTKKEALSIEEVEKMSPDDLRLFVSLCDSGRMTSKVLCFEAKKLLVNASNPIITTNANQQVNVCTTTNSPARWPQPPTMERRPDGLYLAAYSQDNMWAPGSTLRIRFTNGTEDQKNHFMSVIRAWPVGLRFERTESDPSEVRVSLPPIGQLSGASHSLIGKGSLSNSGTTLFIGWDNYQTDQTILHEFGHALGFIHELQQPNAQNVIHWNKSAVYSFYAGSPNFWGTTQVDSQVFSPQPAFNYTAFDASSIMIYPVSKEFTTDGTEIALPMQLSEKDKEFSHQLYPHTQIPGEACGGFAGLACALNYYQYGSDNNYSSVKCVPSCNHAGSLDNTGTCSYANRNLKCVSIEID